MWNKTKANLRLTYDVFVAAGKEFAAVRGSRMAAAVAYRTMFALAPLFLLAVSIAGTVLGSRDAARFEILFRVEELAGPQVRSALSTFLQSVEVSRDSAVILGAALLFWTASSLFMEIQTDLNDIFDVPQERVRGVMGFIRKRTLGVLWVLGIGVALIAVWLVNAVWRYFGDSILPAGAEHLHSLVGWLTPLVSVILLPLLLGLFFQTMVAVKVRWRAIWWGSFFTSVAFLAAAYVVSLYFAWDSETSASQVAASLFVILLLAFVLAAVFLFGAEVTKVYDDYLDNGDVKTPSERNAYRPEIVVSEPERSVTLAAVFAFFAGWLVGWRRRP
ncbi:MAG TPA: YihY/virulence factor BrkB family protein [Acidimicrobiia bacterium]|nr:YihY/virulence factor BrkB family protein [Acidimicrobiia bacterium]